MRSQEFQKEQGEREVLGIFLSCTDRSQWVVQKELHPDFIIIGPDDERVGVEVTRFTPEAMQVIHAIMREYFGKQNHPDEVKKAASKRHGMKAERYQYLKLNGKLAISAQASNISQQKERYAAAIIRKYEKYEALMEQFHRFIILCDARQGIDIIDENDANDIVDYLSNYNFSKAFQVAIIYSNYGRVFCYQKEIKAT